MIYEVTEFKQYKIVADSERDIREFPLFKGKIYKIEQIGSKDWGKVGVYLVTVVGKQVSVWGTSDLPNGK